MRPILPAVVVLLQWQLQQQRQQQLHKVRTTHVVLHDWTAAWCII